MAAQEIAGIGALLKPNKYAPAPPPPSSQKGASTRWDHLSRHAIPAMSPLRLTPPPSGYAGGGVTPASGP